MTNLVERTLDYLGADNKGRKEDRKHHGEGKIIM